MPEELTQDEENHGCGRRCSKHTQKEIPPPSRARLGGGWGQQAMNHTYEPRRTSPAHYTITNPCRMPIVTASVRLSAPSFARICPTWNFAVCSEIWSSVAIDLLGRPSESMRRICSSRGVR